MAILFRTNPVQRILGLLFLSPERDVALSDIVAALEGVAARRTVIYALDQLVREGYVEKRDAGSTRPTYRANQASYLYDELRSIALKTLGGFSPLSEAISTDDNVVAAAIYGSFAKGTARAASDIDLLMVVDDPADPGVTELTRMLDEAAGRLGHSVNVRSYEAGEFERKRQGPFLSRVLAEPLVALKGAFGARTNAKQRGSNVKDPMAGMAASLAAATKLAESARALNSSSYVASFIAQQAQWADRLANLGVGRLIQTPDESVLRAAEAAAQAASAFQIQVDSWVPEVLQRLALDYDRIVAPIQLALHSWEQRLAQLAPEKRRVVLYLAERGWHLSLGLPWWDEELARLVWRGEAAAVDAYVADQVEATLDDLIETVHVRYPARAPVITDAVTAHRQGRYNLSIPAALAQTDGICAEVLEVSAFGSDGHGRPKTATKIEPRITAASTDPFVEWALADLLPLQSGSSLFVHTKVRDMRRESDPDFGPLNRHGVLHGIDSDYGTRENSLRALAVLAYFVALPEMLVDEAPTVP